MQIRKAIIPAAGFGTRFLPVTKAIPKEMLPAGDKPVIHYVVEEAVQAGIDEILIVISRGKEAIPNYFTRDLELERRLEQSGKADLAARLRRISEMARIQYVYQQEMKGLGDAVLCGSSFAGDDPFAVLLGDTIVTPREGGTAMPLPRMVEACNTHGTSVVAVEPVSVEKIGRYGIAGGEETEPGLFRLDRLVEKPLTDEAPRMRLQMVRGEAERGMDGEAKGQKGRGTEGLFYAFTGRYLFTPGLFASLRETPPGKNNEVQLTDAMQRLLSTEGMQAVDLGGTRHDVGTPEGLFDLCAALK